MTKKQRERDEARARLLEMLKPGDTVHTVLRHVSRSGMSRSISAIIYDEEGNNYNIDYLVSSLLGRPVDIKRGGVKIGGCGMDMGFALVYSLSTRLWPDGCGVKGEMPLGHEIRPKTREQAAEAVKRGAKFCGRNGDTSGWENNGGYALKQMWL